MLPSQRHLFDLPADITWLNCAYLSPQLRAVTEAGVEGVGRKARPWTLTPADFFEGSEELRALAARLMGSGPDGVALVPAASYGVAVAARNLPIAEGQSVVVLAEQFPSNLYGWRVAARRRGARIETVPRPSEGPWTAPVLEAIDERTAVVAVPQCHWTDGTLVDLEAVGRRAREVGAALVVDATQSLGALPLDLERVQPDYLVAAGYKWLLGPYSLGYLYVAPHRRAGVPLEDNWIAREGSEQFDRLVDYTERYQPGARRFDVGERSNFVLVPMAAAALRQLLGWGVPAIRERLEWLTGLIEEGSRRLGLAPVPRAVRGGHMLGIRIPGGGAGHLAERLDARRVHVSVRGDSVRVSPHVYNDDQDIERLLAALAGELGLAR